MGAEKGVDLGVDLGVEKGMDFDCKVHVITSTKIALFSASCGVLNLALIRQDLGTPQLGLVPRLFFHMHSVHYC